MVCSNKIERFKIENAMICGQCKFTALSCSCKDAAESVSEVIEHDVRHSVDLQFAGRKRTRTLSLCKRDEVLVVEARLASAHN